MNRLPSHPSNASSYPLGRVGTRVGHAWAFQAPKACPRGSPGVSTRTTSRIASPGWRRKRLVASRVGGITIPLRRAGERRRAECTHGSVHMVQPSTRAPTRPRVADSRF